MEWSKKAPVPFEHFYSLKNTDSKMFFELCTFTF